MDIYTVDITWIWIYKFSRYYMDMDIKIQWILHGYEYIDVVNITWIWIYRCSGYYMDMNI